MSLYVRLYVTFYSHRKTRKLRSLIGDAALWVPPRLWSYAAMSQPDGDFSHYSDEDIAEFIGYRGDASSMIQALLDAGFLDANRKIHDWDEHSGFHELYAARAKKAATARWSKERTKEKEQNRAVLSGAELKEHESSNALSNASSINHYTPTPISVNSSQELYKRLRLTLCMMFGRDPHSPWNHKEEYGLSVISRERPGVEAELEELRIAKLKNSQFFPRKISTLLDDWPSTLDSIRNPNYASNRQTGQQRVSANNGTANANHVGDYSAAAKRILAAKSRDVQNVSGLGADGNGECRNPIPG